MSSLNKIIKIFKNFNKYYFLILLILFTLSALLEMLGLALVIPLIDVISQPEISYEKYSKYFKNSYFIINVENMANTVILLFIIIIVIKNIFIIFVSFQHSNFLKKINIFITNKIFTSILKNNLQFFKTQNSSNLIKALQTEAVHFVSYVINPITFLIIEIMVLISITTVLILYKPVITIGGVLILITSIFIFYKFTNNKIFLWSKKRLNADEQKYKILKYSFDGIKEIKFYNLEKFFSQIFNNSSSEVFYYARNQFFIQQTVKPYLEITIIFLIFVMISINQNLFSNTLLTTIGVFAAAAMRLIPSFNRISMAISNLRFGIPVIHEIEKMTKFTKKKILNSNKISFKKTILIEKLNFYYQGTSFKLENLSLNISRGDIIGISGASGSGKTTLIDILLGLAEVKYARLQVDNKKNIKILKNKSFQIADASYVPQKVFLINDTIENNIAFGTTKNKYNDAKIKHLIKICLLEKLYKKIKFDKSNFIGEFGSKISGGEAQRIGIARALYKKSEFIILDEATNALDKNNEKKILSNLIKHFPLITIILISHHYRSFKFCNKIFKIEKNKLVRIK